MPVIGPMVALGAVAAVIVSIVEGAILGASGSALSAALYSIAIPKDSILDCEQNLKADSFLVFVHGTATDVTQAKTILATLQPVNLTIHEGVSAVARVVPQPQAAA